MKSPIALQAPEEQGREFTFALPPAPRAGLSVIVCLGRVFRPCTESPAGFAPGPPEPPCFQFFRWRVPAGVGVGQSGGWRRRRACGHDPVHPMPKPRPWLLLPAPPPQAWVHAPLPPAAPPAVSPPLDLVPPSTRPGRDPHPHSASAFAACTRPGLTPARVPAPGPPPR